jgi:hypothetical protein
VKQVSPVAYKIKLPTSMKIHDVFHIDLLILYTETEAHGETHPHPPPELIDGEEEYEVEEILADCINRRNKKRQYFVRWKGYEASEDSWVNKQDMSHSPELLEEYCIAKCAPQSI